MIFYRYVGHANYGADPECAPVLQGADIQLLEFEVDRETPKGYWIVPRGFRGCTWKKKRFVLKQSRKRFACPSKDEAWNSFRHRSAWRISHLHRQLNEANVIQAEIEKRNADNEAKADQVAV